MNLKTLVSFDMGYEQLIRSTGVDIIWEDREGSYQGSCILILFDSDTNMYAKSGYAWGSCSMCDCLEGARDENIATYYAMRRSMVEQVIWVEGPEKFIEWLKKHDWEGDWNGVDVMEKNLVGQMVLAVEMHSERRKMS